jgi:hypothetical protein
MSQQEKTVLQQISDVAWLVHCGPSKLGILNKDVQEHYTYITGKELVCFNDETEVIKHFGNMTLFKEQVATPAVKQDKLYIMGYEVDCADRIALDESHPDYDFELPLYTKIEGGSTYYAAGYYCINFEKGWKPSRGTKLSTLKKYGFEGPFKTEIEMRQRLKQLNKIKKQNDAV